MDSQVEQQQDSCNEASDGIPVLTSDSEKSVIFVVEMPFPSIQGPGIMARAVTQALPTFSSSGSDTSSYLGKYLISIIFYCKSYILSISIVYTKLFIVSSQQ